MRATVLAELCGPDREPLAALTRKVADAFTDTCDMAEVWTSVPADMAEYRIQIIRLW